MAPDDRDLLLYLAEYACRVLAARPAPSPRVRAALAQATAQRDALLAERGQDGGMGEDAFARTHRAAADALPHCDCLAATLAKVCVDCARVVLHDARTAAPRACAHDASFFSKHLHFPSPRHLQHADPALYSPLRRCLSSPHLAGSAHSRLASSFFPDNGIAQGDLFGSEGSTPASDDDQPAADTSGASLRLRRSGGSMREWEIPFHSLEIEDKVGSGSFGLLAGTVYRARWHGPVAVKVLNVVNPSQAQLTAFRNEVAVLRKTRHTNVLLFIGACTDLPNLAIVTRWCEGKSLYHHLHVANTDFPMIHILDMAKQTAEGMSYLHAKNIIHRDLKSGNILLQQAEQESPPVVQIADFGLAMVKGQWTGQGDTLGPTGSVLWMAPEIITMKTHTDPYTPRSDVYAYGIVLYEMFTSALPYVNRPMEQIIYLVGTGALTPDFTLARADTPTPAVNIMHSCLSWSALSRPEFSTLVTQIEIAYRCTPVLTRSSSDTIVRVDGYFRKSLGAGYTPRPLSIRRRSMRQSTIPEDDELFIGSPNSPPESTSSGCLTTPSPQTQRVQRFTNSRLASARANSECPSSGDTSVPSECGSAPDTGISISSTARTLLKTANGVPLCDLMDSPLSSPSSPTTPRASCSPPQPAADADRPKAADPTSAGSASSSRRTSGHSDVGGCADSPPQTRMSLLTVPLHRHADMARCNVTYV